MPKPNINTFEWRLGQRLRALRLKHGYTQTALADRAGVDRSFLSDVERGFKNISALYLHTLACTYAMTVSELLEGV